MAKQTLSQALELAVREDGALGRFFRKGNQQDPFIDKEDIL